MTIAIYDTYCGSLNSGDAIIMDAISQHLDLLFPYLHKVSYPTHYPLSLKAIRKIKKSNICFVGGTNLLTSQVHLRSKKNQWSIGHLGAIFIKQHSVLLGCGWKNYQNLHDLKSKIFYKTILSKKYFHSVRDNYSKKKMKELGFLNVINTGCPTLWNLTPSHCNTIPKTKAKNVVFTLTDYRKNPELDKKFIHIISSLYDKVYFWAQGANDLEYLHHLTLNKPQKTITLLGPSLPQYDHFLLNTKDIDYVGTRLHAGIRAMQSQHRSIIIGIDNRAIEKKIDFNLVVVDRENIGQLSKTITAPFKTEIKLPTTEIESWKAQFNQPNLTI
jgi:polysaccharide pyruvyl transferase WcaK-like protein